MTTIQQLSSQKIVRDLLADAITVTAYELEDTSVEKSQREDLIDIYEAYEEAADTLNYVGFSWKSIDFYMWLREEIKDITGE